MFSNEINENIQRIIIVIDSMKNFYKEKYRKEVAQKEYENDRMTRENNEDYERIKNEMNAFLDRVYTDNPDLKPVNFFFGSLGKIPFKMHSLLNSLSDSCSFFNA